jgi:hypothetical protein
VNRAAAAALALALGHCAAAPPRPLTVTPPRPVALLVVVPAHAARTGPAHTLTLTADGVATLDGRAFARVTRVAIEDASGAPLATVTGDGTVRVANTSRSLRLDAGGLLRDDGVRVLVGDDGRVLLRDASGATVPSPWILTRQEPAGDGAALLLLLLAAGPDPASRESIAPRAGVLGPPSGVRP